MRRASGNLAQYSPPSPSSFVMVNCPSNARARCAADSTATVMWIAFVVYLQVLFGESHIHDHGDQESSQLIVGS